MLNQSLSGALRTTKKHLEKLKLLGLKTVEDLLNYFPRTYQDQTQLTKIVDVRTDETNVIRGILSNITSRHSRQGKFLLHALLTDETGSIEVVWFNQPHLSKLLRSGLEVILAGRAKFALGKISLQNPAYEPINSVQVHTARIIPIYHETEGISSKWIRQKIHALLPLLDQINDYLPAEICQRQKLLSWPEAVYQVHFPDNQKSLDLARQRLAFDELLIIQWISLKRRLEWRQAAKNFSRNSPDVSDLDSLIKKLPFTLTKAQLRSLEEIVSDLKADYPMLRLLEGDVGSGKTIVAGLAALLIMRTQAQVALMAPTEILAKQHYKTFSKFFADYGYRFELLVGSLSSSRKKQIYEDLKNGVINLAIGTHALIQEGVSFSRLGLAIIDEQHRFGVKQRDQLKSHGQPHLLNLSATPIPRTLAMTMYGDQDLSIIDELPPGRQTIITRIVPEYKRLDAYRWITEQVKKGRQVYVICPLIDESDVLQLKAVTTEYERLQTEIFPDLRLGLLHGKLKQPEKDLMMEQFSKGEIDVLVSTSVVEVGIDVPNATIMMIEGAERFGLSQLHQFRGRVGRGEHQSYCFLLPSLDSPAVNERLKAMVQHSSGFKLAEIDLELRGPGEIYGVKQSGIPDLKMASLSDSVLIARARTEAEWLIDNDPELLKYSELKRKISAMIGS